MTDGNAIADTSVDAAEDVAVLEPVGGPRPVHRISQHHNELQMSSMSVESAHVKGDRRSIEVVRCVVHYRGPAAPTGRSPGQKPTRQPARFLEWSSQTYYDQIYEFLCAYLQSSSHINTVTMSK